MKALILLILALSESIALAIPAELKILPDIGKTEFLAVGRPAMMKIRGEAKAPTGSLVMLVGGTLELPLSQLSTGIDLRDKHMKEKYLETDKYPKALLKLKPFALPKLEENSPAVNIPFEGDLTLHGVTNPVKGSADVSYKNKEYSIAAQYSLHLSDFKVEIPSYMGIKVADDVTVNVQFKTQGN